MIRTILNRLNSEWKKLFAKTNPVLASKLFHKKKTGRELDLKNPKRFRDKCHWLKLYWNHPQVVQCTDKYEVRLWIAQQGHAEILNDLYGVYNQTSEINWEKLPKQFVLKGTHGYNFNIICRDKDAFDRQKAILRMNRWLKSTYGIKTVELHYRKIKPRIICERLIDTASSAPLVDYKFYCFGGKAHCVMVCTGRGSKQMYFDYFDRNWTQKLDYDQGRSPDHIAIEKPVSYEKMIEVAENLSSQFPFVRVDLYDDKGKVIFGEMTFTPAACSDPGLTPEGDVTMGKLLKLP